MKKKQNKLKCAIKKRAVIGQWRKNSSVQNKSKN